MHLFLPSLVRLQYLLILLDDGQIVLNKVRLLAINGRLVYLLILSDVVAAVTSVPNAAQGPLLIRGTLGSTFGAAL